MKNAKTVVTALISLWLVFSGRAQPVIITQPVNATNQVGQLVSTTFSVIASGAGPLSYQWQKVGTNLVNGTFYPARANVAGALTSTLTLTGMTTNDEAYYACRVTNTSGSVTSSIATLTIIVPPSLTTQPVSHNATIGSSVTFTVTATGTAPFVYQWYENSLLIASATLSSYTINNLTTNYSGNTYSVKVSNAAGVAPSTNAVLNVGTAPGSVFITPTSLTVTQGQAATFNVTASGTPLNYFWRKGGVFIAGATNSFLTFSNTVPTNAATTYTCLASNFLNLAGSGNATLIVDYGPIITNQPASQTVGVGSNFTVSVGAVAVPVPTYQWFTNSGAIAGATNSSYTVTNAQISDGAGYSVAIANSQGSTNSAVAAINVLNYAPIITTQPAGGNVAVGNTFLLTASAIGTAPLSWQWRSNTVPIPGANTNTWLLGPVQVSDTGYYDVVVANLAGSTSSVPALVNVGYPPVAMLQPAFSLTNNVGDTTGFSCIVTGTAPFNLQWTLNAFALAGATNSGIVLTNVQTTNIGFYALLATNVFGSAASSNAQLNLTGYVFSQWAGLEAYYALNGNATDSSGNGNNGTNFGAVAASDRFGNAGGAMAFSGAGNYIRCKSGAYFGSQYSVTAWVNATAYNSSSHILDFGNGQAADNTDLALTSGNSGLPYFEAYIGGTQVGDCGAVTPIGSNQWVYLVGTCTETQICLYYNGVLQASNTAAVNRAAPVDTIFNYLGRSNWGAYAYFAGRLDDIRIFDRALSADEVAQLYLLESQTTLMPPAGLILSGNIVGGTTFNLTLTNLPPGSNYVVQFATNLAPPVTWQPAVTNAADTNGVWQFADTNLDSAQKFYRVTTP